MGLFGLGAGPLFQLGAGGLSFLQELITNAQNNQAREGITLGALEGYTRQKQGFDRDIGRIGNELIDQYQGVDRAALAGLQGIGANQSGWFNNLSSNLLSGQNAEYDALQRGFNQRAGTVLSGLQQTHGNMMNYLQGAGTQEKLDAAQAWREKNAADQLNLSQRGMAGTTVGSTLATGNTREKEAEMRRINERLQQQRLGVEGQMGLAKANMQAGLMGDALNFGAMSAQNRIGMQQQLGMQGLGLQDALAREQLNQQIAGMTRPLQIGEQYSQQKIGTGLDIQNNYLNALMGIPVPANTNYGLGNMAQIMGNIQSANAMERYGKSQQGLFGGHGNQILGGAGMAAGIPLMLTNMAAPGVGFGLGAALTGMGATSFFGGQ